MIFQGDVGPAGKAGEPGDQGLRVSYGCKSSSQKESMSQMCQKCRLRNLDLAERLNKKLFSGILFKK